MNDWSISGHYCQKHGQRRATAEGSGCACSECCAELAAKADRLEAEITRLHEFYAKDETYDEIKADRDRLAGLIRAAEEDLGNVIYQIETGELRDAREWVTAIRSRLDAAKEVKP